MTIDTTVIEIEHDYPRIDVIHEGRVDDRLRGFEAHAGGTYWGYDGLLRAARAGAPRLTWDPISGALLGILVESDRANADAAPEDFTTWAATNCSVTQDAGTAPDGAVAMDEIDDVSSVAAAYLTKSFPAYVAGQVVTGAIFLKIGTASGSVVEYNVYGAGGGWGGEFALQYDHQSDTVTLAGSPPTAASVLEYGVEPLSGGVFRLWITWQMDTTPGVGTVARIWPNSRQQAETGSIFAWGHDIGLGAHSTYCPSVRVSGSIAISGTDFSDLWQDEGGSLVVEAIPFSVARNASIVSVDDATTSNRIGIRILSLTEGYGAVGVRGGAFQWNASGGPAVIGTATRAAVSFEDDAISMAENGSVYATDSAATIPTQVDGLTQIRIGEGALPPFSGIVSRLAYYPRVLSSQEIETRSGVGRDNDILRVATSPVEGASDVLPRLVGSPRYSGRLGFWIWQNRRTESGVGDAEVINIDNALDYLHTRDLRGKPARIYTGARDDALGDFDLVADLRVDFLEGGPNQRLRIVFASLARALSSKVARGYYSAADTDIDELIGKPMPIFFGDPAQVEPVLSDTVALQFDFSDRPVLDESSAEDVRSNGFPALEEQFDTAGRGFTMSVTPESLVTCSVANTDPASSSIARILPDFLVTRAAFTSGLENLTDDIETISFAGDGAIGDIVSMADYMTSDERADDVITRWLDGWLATWYVDAMGRIRLVRLPVPEDFGQTPDLEVSQVPAGETPRPRDDLMPGLTISIGAGRRFRPIGRESADTALEIAEKEQVAREWRIIERGRASDLDPFYTWAAGGAIMETALTESTGAGAAATGAAQLLRQVTRAAGRRRRFWEYPTILSAETPLQLGAHVRATFDGVGLEGGKDLALVGFDRPFVGLRVNLLLWG